MIKFELYDVWHLTRITGLDPANPPFFPAILLDHLSYADAEFVDIIHTDAGLYGQPYATGTVDFWPNDGNTEYGIPKIYSESSFFCSIKVDSVFL